MLRFPPDFWLFPSITEALASPATIVKMKFVSVAVSSLLLSRANALVDLPAVSGVVNKALEEFSQYVTAAHHEATPAPAVSRDASSGVRARQAVTDPEYWLADITHQGIAAFNSDPSTYVVFRNVKDYGAAGV
jgi:glucan 1,3-beta-glucosidase